MPKWANPSAVAGGESNRPEEPAKYISELPKLVQADLSTSAVVCGNWLAQVKQIFQGLSPSADIWFSAVEAAANQGYSRWLVADPLGRLSLDPGSVVATLDMHKFQRVESRAVTLLLASVTNQVRDDIIANRWLTTAAILYRILCVYQPGGSSERAQLLSQLVTPEVCKGFQDAIRVFRRWQQSLQRATEIRATLPDPSLLLKGVDSATVSLLANSPMVAFRVNSYRHSIALDYNPTTTGVTQLVRLLQAESEAASLVEMSAEKRAKNAALGTREAPPSKAPPSPPVAPSGGTSPTSGAAVNAVGVDAKGKGKNKGGDGATSACHKFADASGCRFGDSCMFKHDRSKARREGRCLACGQSGHFRPDCTLVSPENRVVQSEGGKIAHLVQRGVALPREGSRTDSSLFSKQQSSGHEPSEQHVFCTADKDLTASNPPRTCLAFVRIGLFYALTGLLINVHSCVTQDVFFVALSGANTQQARNAQKTTCAWLIKAVFPHVELPLSSLLLKSFDRRYLLVQSVEAPGRSKFGIRPERSISSMPGPGN